MSLFYIKFKPKIDLYFFPLNLNKYAIYAPTEMYSQAHKIHGESN